MKSSILMVLYFHYKLFTQRAAIRVIFGIMHSNWAAAIAQSCPARVREKHGRNLKPYIKQADSHNFY